jgi:two-component system CheB/CheR fusion protein
MTNGDNHAVAKTPKTPKTPRSPKHPLAGTDPAQTQATAAKGASNSAAQLKPAPTTDASSAFPIVGIGASAGGLAAFEAFFAGMPAEQDPGMAFVLVQHLAPDHKSMLSELIRGYTRMQVFEVEDGMAVEVNCVYIIPPNHNMAIADGRLTLRQYPVPRGQRLPIDLFFKSMADDQHELAIGIVLSGTGSDGTQGVLAIHNAGGMVMAQRAETNEFDGMPRSAIATGVVDYQLHPAEMAAQLMTYAAHDFASRALSGPPAMHKREHALKSIFDLLSAQTGHDFSQYKRRTINRRIARRMAVRQTPSVDAYVKYLEQTPGEVDELFRDLLIGVTSFFRDPEAFQALQEQIIPQLFSGKPAGSAVRVWTAACSTGEEAYSLAILLFEQMEQLKQGVSVQVFATDIDSRAIATARAGRYPVSIAADISPTRLARFFSLEPGGQDYRIEQNIRDLLVFSEHNLIKDPPFSKLDLISCRNLMIYLDSNLQKRLIELFHYALVPTGKLFLGAAEGVGEPNNLFAVLDRKAKLYQRKEDLLASPRASINHFVARTMTRDVALPNLGPHKPAPKLRLREVMERALLKQIAPASALVNAAGDILYLYGRAGMYLEPAMGEAGVQNIIKMARDGLRSSLGHALQQAAASQRASHARNLQVKTNGHCTAVNLSVHPVSDVELSPVDEQIAADALRTPLYLIILQEAPPAAQMPSLPENGALAPDAQAQAQIESLMLELRSKDEYLQRTHEELEGSYQELRSSNEEMLSANEELQSTNEELETSKEELQSVNEELATVNLELQSKLSDLSRINSDMNNLLAGTGIASVFVDHQLRILRFTPAARDIIHLLETDMGRPVAHIASNLLGYTTLDADVRSVLNTLIPQELEVQSLEGNWYLQRILPYRTLNNVIEGAVISFVDITEIVTARARLKDANNMLRLAVVVHDAQDAITVQDLNGQILAWNPGATRLYGWSEAQALAMNVTERIPEGRQAGALDAIARLSRADVLQPYLTQRLSQSGALLNVAITSTALLDKLGEVYAIATTERLVSGDTPHDHAAAAPAS